MNDIVFQMRVTDIVNLRKRIRTAMETTNAGMLNPTWKEIEYRLNMLLVTGGAHMCNAYDK